MATFLLCQIDEQMSDKEDKKLCGGMISLCDHKILGRPWHSPTLPFLKATSEYFDHFSELKIPREIVSEQALRYFKTFLSTFLFPDVLTADSYGVGDGL